MEVMPDEVDLFLKVGRILGPDYIVQQIKGYTSGNVREKILALKKKLLTLWARSYFIENIGHISERTIKKYMEDKKGNKLQR